MMKTHEPSTFNFSTYTYDEEAELAKQKQKLVYSSDFLKSFNKGKSLDYAEKEQIEQLTTIIHKLKDIIEENKDEAMTKKMNDVFLSCDSGRIISGGKKNAITPLSLPVQGDQSETAIVGFEHTIPISPTSLALENNSQFNKQSPRGGVVSNNSAISVSPSSSSNSLLTSAAAPTAQRPPLQRAPSTGKLPLPSSSASASTIGLQSTALPPSSSSSSGPASISTATNGGAYVPPSQRVMKRSPSMPVINDQKSQSSSSSVAVDPSSSSSLSSNKIRKSPSFTMVDTVKKPSSSSSSSSTSLDDKKLAPSSSSLTASAVSKDYVASSRPKGIKKSVSMSSISMDDKNAGALKCTSLEEIVGQIYPLTKYQAGCRFLQKKLEEQPDPVHVSLVFNEVYEHLVELMTDPYGQYLVPKLMYYCDVEQRQAIVTKIAPKISSFACHTYGIHGVQKILEYLTDDQVTTIIDVIRPNVVNLGKDAKGNYLLQSFLKQFTPEKNQFIFDSVNSNVIEVCTHKVGCTLVNKCIDHANPSQLVEIMESVAKYCLPLVQDQYGNYVVQHILDNKPSFAPIISKSMLGNIPMLCVQKFSSNVIEKCLQVSVQKNPEIYEAIMKEVTDANLLDLLQDKYANFVIQTALDVANEEQHAHLVKLILPFIHQIKTPYVMHIQKKILQV